MYVCGMSFKESLKLQRIPGSVFVLRKVVIRRIEFFNEVEIGSTLTTLQFETDNFSTLIV